MTKIVQNNENIGVKKTVSVRVDEIEYAIIKKICEKKGVSLNSYINRIIIKYIYNNSDKIKEKLNIDIYGIRSQILAESKRIKFKKELNEFERTAIDNILEIFKTALEITEEKLKQLLNLSQESLEKILFYNSEELKKKGLTLKYKLGNIIKKED